MEKIPMNAAPMSYIDDRSLFYAISNLWGKNNSGHKG